MPGLLRRWGGAVSAMALILVVSGGAVCAAWLAGVSELTRLLPESTAMQFPTAVLFVLAGISLMAGAWRRPSLAAVTGALVALYAALVLYEYVRGIDFGIDTLFLDLGPTAMRVAPNTAVTFVLAGAALVLMALSRRAPWALGIVPMLGALVVAIGATALIGYLIDLASAAQWAGLARMAILTAADVVLLGGALVLAAVGDAPREGWLRLPWLAASAGVGMAALAALGWYALMHAPDARQAQVANVVLALGLGIAALLAGTIAQAGHLGRQSRELARINQELHATSEEVRDLYDHAPCGYHSLDRDGVFVRINQTECDWLGYPREELLGRRRIAEFMTPASQALVREEFPRYVQRGAVHNLELELVRRDGSVLPVLASATAIFDDHGQYLHSRSTLFDMSERKRAEVALRESENRLQLVLENLQTAVVLHGPDTGIRYVNPAAVAMLGLTRDQLMGKTTIDGYWHFVREDETPMPVEEYPVHKVLDGKVALQDYVVGIRTAPDRPTRWALVNAIPEVEADGGVRRVIVSFMDITERKRHAEAMQHLALTDSLTGLATRRHFLAEAERELSRCRRSGAAMSVLMMDVDHFKAVNDRYGHAAGDLVLVQLARTLHAILRDSDMAGRLGGEEFCVLLPATPEGVALEIAERLREAIAAAPAPLPDGRALRFTVSIGVAMLEPDDDGLGAVLGRADGAMYQAKRAGRNQVGVARPALAH